MTGPAATWTGTPRTSSPLTSLPPPGNGAAYISSARLPAAGRSCSGHRCGYFAAVHTVTPRVNGNRRSVRVGETAPGWLRPCITAVLRATSRWRGRLPGRLPRRSAARCWWSRSDAQTEAALQHMPVSASWAPRRNAVLGAQLKACARNRPPGVPGRRSWGPPSEQAGRAARRATARRDVLRSA